MTQTVPLITRKMIEMARIEVPATLDQAYAGRETLTPFEILGVDFDPAVRLEIVLRTPIIPELELAELAGMIARRAFRSTTPAAQLQAVTALQAEICAALRQLAQTDADLVSGELVPRRHMVKHAEQFAHAYVVRAKLKAAQADVMDMLCHANESTAQWFAARAVLYAASAVPPVTIFSAPKHPTLLAAVEAAQAWRRADPGVLDDETYRAELLHSVGLVCAVLETLYGKPPIEEVTQ